MALVKCPECSREVSDQANSCPHCGFPLAPPIAAPAPNELDARIREILAREGKIAAIKFYRERTPGVGLADAKNYVERLEGRLLGSGQKSAVTNEPSKPIKRGCSCAILIVMFLIVAAVLVMFLARR